MRVRFRLEAATDVDAARAWYDEKRTGLGDDFVASLEHVIQLISEFPDAFPEIAAGHRRAHLHRFPYAVYYRVDREGIDVLACLHGLRKVRFARPSRREGKSGGTRVIYYFIQRKDRIYFIEVYAKGVKGNLTRAEENGLREVAKALEGEK